MSYYIFDAIADTQNSLPPSTKVFQYLVQKNLRIKYSVTMHIWKRDEFKHLFSGAISLPLNWS